MYIYNSHFLLFSSIPLLDPLNDQPRVLNSLFVHGKGFSFQVLYLSVLNDDSFPQECPEASLNVPEGF